VSLDSFSRRNPEGDHRGALFVIGWNGGTLAPNSAFDQDGRYGWSAAPSSSSGLALFGFGLMLLGLAASLAGAGFLVAFDLPAARCCIQCRCSGSRPAVIG
jgi:hypothetical protein